MLFFSDHGEMLGSHYRGQKGVPLEESINIPFIVNGPDIAVGRVYNLPICTEDIHPTTLGLAGLGRAPSLPGLDLSAWLRNPAQAPERPYVLCQQVNELRQNQFTLMRIPWRALRSERYSFAVLTDQLWFLYDKRKDPYQQRNLVNESTARELLEWFSWELAGQLEAAEDQFAFDPRRALNDPPAEPVWDIPVLVPET